MSPLRKSHRPLAAFLVLFSLFVMSVFTLPMHASAYWWATLTPTAPPLVQIAYQGGMCADHACYSSTTIYRDGSVGYYRQGGYVVTGFEGIGRLDRASVDRLESLIETTDIATLRTTKFTDICPTAYDGSETVYTFYRSKGTEIISSCEYVIDHSHPLIKALDEALQRAEAVITPIVTSTSLPSITPTTVATPLLEALRQKLATGWHCVRATVTYEGSLYRFDCQIAPATSVTVTFQQFETEADAQRAFPLIPNAVTTTFHGFPAATGITSKTEHETVEVFVIQARRVIVTIYSHLEFIYGLHAADAAESVYWAALDLGMVDFQPIPTQTPMP